MQCISFLLLVTDCQAAGCSLPALAESHRAGGASAPGPSLEKGPPRPPGLLAGPFPESGARRPCILLAGGWQCPLWPSPWLSHQVSTVRRCNHARFYNLKQAPGPAHSHGEGDTMGWSPPPAREMKLQQGLREGPPIRAKVKEAWFDVGRDQEVGGRAEVACRLCRPHIHLCCGGSQLSTLGPRWFCV